VKCADKEGMELKCSNLPQISLQQHMFSASQAQRVDGVDIIVAVVGFS
jgi:hypothetical protein